MMIVENQEKNLKYKTLLWYGCLKIKKNTDEKLSKYKAKLCYYGG